MKRHRALEINTKFYYGWVIVFVAALGMFFSAPGQTYALSAFVDEYIDVFGFDKTTISLLYSIATVLSGSLLFLLGRMVDRFGQKKIMIVAGIMLAFATMFNSLVSTIPMIFVGFFLSRYFGQGAMSMVPSTLVPQWFHKKRGFAFGLFRSGHIIGTILIPVMNVYFIQTIGWQNTWRIWSVLLLLIFVPTVYMFVINTPEQIGLKPDNEATDALKEEKEQQRIEKESWHLKEATRTKSFWFLGFVSGISPFIATGLGFHFMSMMSERGLDEVKAGMVLGMMGVPGLVFPLAVGKVIDKIQPNKLLALMLFFEAVGLIMLNFSDNIAWLIAATIVFGIGSSSQSIAGGVMWSNFFGRKHLGTIQSVSTIFIVWGSAAGSILMGWGYDMTGSYSATIIMMACIAVIGAVLATYTKAPIKPLK